MGISIGRPSMKEVGTFLLMILFWLIVETVRLCWTKFTSWLMTLHWDQKKFGTLILLLSLCMIKYWTGSNSDPRLIYSITQTWDGTLVDQSAFKLTLLPHNDAAVKLLVEAPFFNDPPKPEGKPGETFPGLWDYEVVEALFLNDDDNYLEVELSPHGQHLVLLFKGCRKLHRDELPLEFNATVDGDVWKGEVLIPAIYFPKKVTKFNAFAIHGSDDKRIYQALYPATSDEYTDPDFHRLEYFQPIDFTSILPANSEDG